MDVNDYQVGGNHYVRDYQHWDFVIDTGMHYLLGCATKYITRWRKKNGLEDLKKPIHYLTKAEDADVEAPKCNPIFVDRFIHDMPTEDGLIIKAIMENQFERAQYLIALLIQEVECGADTNYVNQD